MTSYGGVTTCARSGMRCGSYRSARNGMISAMGPPREMKKGHATRVTSEDDMQPQLTTRRPLLGFDVTVLGRLHRVKGKGRLLGLLLVCASIGACAGPALVPDVPGM